MKQQSLAVLAVKKSIVNLLLIYVFIFIARFCCFCEIDRISTLTVLGGSKLLSPTWPAKHRGCHPYSRFLGNIAYRTFLLLMLVYLWFGIMQFHTGDMAVTVGSLSVYKWLTFVSMYVGYTLIVFNRKSFTFALPAIIASINLDKDDAGKL